MGSAMNTVRSISRFNLPRFSTDSTMSPLERNVSFEIAIGLSASEINDQAKIDPAINVDNRRW